MAEFGSQRRQKWIARSAARQRRKMLFDDSAAQKLIENFPEALTQNCVAGFAPIGDEINLWPLLEHLRDTGRTVGLPVTGPKPSPLTFREWSKDCEMDCDQYGIQYPKDGAILKPSLLLVPLLAFTANGRRLGYGGGYYDRTLRALRREGEVFACGVAYAGQEISSLPTDVHDEPLDGILTETSFRFVT